MHQPVFAYLSQSSLQRDYIRQNKSKKIRAEGSESVESNKRLLMGIYVQWSILQLAKAKTLLVTRDYQIILTNGGLLYNDLFSFLQDRASCSPHYLWVVLKSRYRTMNVRLSVCVMGLIMVSCAAHNEPHPRRKAISSSPLV